MTDTTSPRELDEAATSLAAAPASDGGGGALERDEPPDRGAASPRPQDLDPRVWPRVVVDGAVGAARSEWLLANGAGGYASSTVAGMHTRRYHGLLVAALDAPRSRHVILSHVDAKIASPAATGGAARVVPARRAEGAGSDVGPWSLAKHQFPGTDPLEGEFFLRYFAQDPLPRWSYVVPAGELELILALVRGQNAVVLAYRWRGPEPILLTLRPLLAMRPYHALQRENGGMVQRVELRAGNGDRGREVRVQPKRDLPRVCFRHEGTFLGSPDWWRRFEYLAERDRGLDFQEDLWTPGVFEMLVEPGATAYLTVATSELPDLDPASALLAARAARLQLDPGPERDPLERRLHIAADAFRADLAAHPAIVAGYPWFEVWGRDALIAFPGLYLVPGRIDDGLRVLRETIDSMAHGLVPNRISDQGAAPEFFSADATLWLFEAARLVADELGDGHRFVTDHLLLALRDAFDAVIAGTRHRIRLTEDGLFAAGEPGDSITWMDARAFGKAITPRVGCPVELSALWAKGCETLARLARAAGDQPLAERATAACRRARAAFRARFWCEETGYPYDVISPEPDGAGAFRDASVRPNALIALAVDRESFTSEQAGMILERARQDLVTRAGIRTLAPAEPGYVGQYGGDVAARDGAYHQGTAWPFLTGFYVRASRNGIDVGEHMTPLLKRLCEATASNELALGQVPEIASGDAPHTPAGCVAQAWSVAELLRALAWDLAPSPRR